MMFNGIKDWCTKEGINPAEERPELSPHYDATKDSFKKFNSVTFCSKCDDGKCACNRYIVHMFIAACKLIQRLDELGSGKKIILTVHHFFRQDEIEHFLKKFTEVRRLKNCDASKFVFTDCYCSQLNVLMAI